MKFLVVKAETLLEGEGLLADVAGVGCRGLVEVVVGVEVFTGVEVKET